MPAIPYGCFSHGGGVARGVRWAWVARGSSTLSSIGASNSNIALSYTGDLAEFISFTANEAATPTWLTGNLRIRATFGARARDHRTQLYLAHLIHGMAGIRLAGVA